MIFSKGCPYCGGEIGDGTTTFTVDKQTVLVVVREVPAHVCQQCGETWIMDSVAEELEKYIVNAEKSHRQFEVISMAA